MGILSEYPLSNKVKKGVRVMLEIGFRPILAVGFFALVSVSSLGAIAANPSLEMIVSPVLSRGQETVLIARGSALGEASEAIFYSSNIRCSQIEVVNDEELRLHLEVNQDCPLGQQGLRIRTPDGISELRTVWVSPFSIVAEIESTEPQRVGVSQENAMELVNQTVSGTLSGDDVDVFHVFAKKGMRLSAEVVAVRLGVNLLDTKLKLKSPAGKDLIQVDDTALLNQDPAFSILASEEGIYTLELTSVNSNADADSPYALHIGSFPRPEGVYPLGGASKTDIELTFWNSPESNVNSVRKTYRFEGEGSSIEQVELEIEGQVCPSPFPFRISPFSDPSGKPSGETSGETSVLGVTKGWNGCIRSAGQIDKVSFESQQAGDLVVEVFATRLGSKLDSVIEVSDESGNVVAAGDDFDSLDSRVVFRAAGSSRYQVSIRDKRSKAGEAYAYYLEVTPARPNLTTFLPRRDKLSQLHQSIAIPQGNRTLVFLGVQRDRIDAPAVMTLQNLPQGVGVELKEVPSGRFLVPVVLSASQSGGNVGGLVQVIGTTTDGDAIVQGGFRQTIDLVNGPADALFQPITVDRLALAVVKPSPFRIELKQPTQPLTVDGELTIQFEIERASDFRSAMEVIMPLLPDWVECESKTRVAADQSTGTIVLRSNARAYPGEWPLVLETNVGIGESSVEGSIGASEALSSSGSSINMHSVSSSLRSITIAKSPIQGQMEPLSVECDSVVEFECRFRCEDSVPEKLIATLEGLPNRVTAPSVVVDRDAGLVKFSVTLAADAPTGTFHQIYCRFAGKKTGEQVAFCVARNSKLVIAAKGQSQKDETGRPLSPLEALRRRAGK